MVVSVIIVAGFEFARTTRSLLTQGEARLSSRIVKLGSLTDDYRTRADNEHLFYISSLSTLLRLLHIVDKLTEQIAAVLRTGRALG